VEIGLLITPWPIAIAFAAPLAGRLVERYPAGLLGGIGLLLFAGGLGVLAFLPAHPTTLDVVWRMALSGAGFGLFQSPNNRTMIAAAPRERSGGASGMLGTARLLGVVCVKFCKKRLGILERVSISFLCVGAFSGAIQQTGAQTYP
jgi:DHA2 family multidrug resistance protein-like MFS transporter